MERNDLIKILCERYNINAAEANETLSRLGNPYKYNTDPCYKDILKELFGKSLVTNETEFNKLLDYYEELGGY